MGKEVKFKDKSNKKESSTETNTIVQFFQIIFVCLIVVLVITSEAVVLSVHVFYSNIGWMLLMVQGLLVFRGINPLFRKVLGKDTIFIHWVIETMALIGACIAFASAYQDKVDKNKDHFVTWHGIFGLIGFILIIMSGLNGVPTLYRKELKRFISPKFIKFVHILTGTVGFFFGGLALIMSCYTNWFSKRTSASLISFYIAIILVISVVTWTLVRPIEKVLKNWRKLYS